MKAQVHFVSTKDTKHSHEALRTWKQSPSQKSKYAKSVGTHVPLTFGKIQSRSFNTSKRINKYEILH